MLGFCVTEPSTLMTSFSLGASFTAIGVGGAGLVAGADCGWEALAFSAAFLRCSQMLPLTGAGTFAAGAGVGARTGVVAGAGFCDGVSVRLGAGFCFCAGMAVCLASVLCLLSGFDVLDGCGCGVAVFREAAGFGDLVDVRDCDWDWDCAGGGRDILSGRAPLHALRIISLCAT